MMWGEVPSPSPQLILLVVYLVVGPLTWIAFGSLINLGNRKLRLMKRIGALRDDPPAVTILVPAKDEGARIADCLNSIAQQDYPNLKIVAIDDRSTDQTGTVMDSLAERYPALQVLHNTVAPPPGWTGKNSALQQGIPLAHGQWLLFVDSDVVLRSDAVSTAMHVVLRKRFDMLSILPRLETHGFWEGLMMPLAGGATGAMYLIALTNNAPWKGHAFGNGQFLLISRAAYDAVGGHVAVRDQFCEDVVMAERVRRHGMRPRVSWGLDHAAVRMYSSLEDIIRGWSRIYYAARSGKMGRIIAASVFLVVCCFSVYPALVWGLVHVHQDWISAAWLIAASIHWLAMTAHLSSVYSWSGNRRRWALLFPVGGAILLWILGRAIRMCITKKVIWRGTSYSHAMGAGIPASGGTIKQPAVTTEN